MKACIVAVGSEMLTPFRVDTNSLVITERLNAIGYDVRLKAVVGDDVERAGAGARRCAGWADLIVITGGLGPTEDDITRDAVARVLDVPLDVDEAIVERIRERFARARHDDAGDQPAAGDGAARRDGARRTRTAPRRACGSSTARTAIVLLPGPPREMKPMLEAVIARAAGAASRRRRPVPARAEDHRPHRIGRRRARAAGLRQVDDAADADQHDDSRRARADRTAPDGARGEPRARPTPRSTRRSSELRGRARPVGLQRRRPGARSGRRRSAARAAADDCACAESCTGGLLTSRLTDVPGSSDYVDRGVVCYSNRAKTELLGVPEALIAEHGAVSEPVARRWPRASARARGRRRRRRHHRHRRARRRHAGEAGRHGRHRGRRADERRAGAHVSVPRRPRDGEVPGGAGGAEHAAR